MVRCFIDMGEFIKYYQDASFCTSYKACFQVHNRLKMYQCGP